MTPGSQDATLIYNPIAGSWDWSSVVNSVLRFWQARGWTVRINLTTETGHATALARDAAARGDGLVLVAGGDGTLNEVVNGLVHSETALALLPVGTANSFAKELGLACPKLFDDRWLLSASEALEAGRLQRMDVGLCDNGRHWILWASTGIDGFVVRQIEPRPLWFKRLGPAGYFAKALFFLPKFPGIHAVIQVDDQTVEGEFLLVTVANCQKYAGGELWLNESGVLDDGIFEVWLFRGRNWPSLFEYTLDISMANHASNPNVTLLRGRHVSISTTPNMDFHLDGEPMGMTPFTCEIVPQALRILIPSTAPTTLFAQRGEPLRTYP